MNKKSNPTGGDWYLEESLSDYEGQQIMAGNRCIAVTVTLESAKESAEEKANARLLVNAPNLLGGCRACLIILQYELRRIREESGTDCPAYHATEDSINEFKAIIEAATGEKL